MVLVGKTERPLSHNDDVHASTHPWISLGVL
jgi:hypothetical protein